MAMESAMGEYLASKTGPFVSLGVSSYVYLPITEFVPGDEQQTLDELLEANSGDYSPSAPPRGLYHETASPILENKDGGSGTFQAGAAQPVRATDPDSYHHPHLATRDQLSNVPPNPYTPTPKPQTLTQNHQINPTHSSPRSARH